MLISKSTEQEIIDVYVQKNVTIPDLGKLFGVGRVKIGNILKKYNIKIIKGRKGEAKNRKDKDHAIKCIVKRKPFDLDIRDLEPYQDREKLSFLCFAIRSQFKSTYNTKQKFLSYLNKFYDDNYFNFIYQRWISNDKNTLFKPSIDHLIPRSRGGTWELDNIVFLTWFENLAKLNMTWEEWQLFKKQFDCKSDLFL
mgnify:CR=1 FL=1